MSLVVQKPGAHGSGLLLARAAFPVHPPESESAGFALDSVAGIFQRGCKILLALASEFFLGRLEAGDPCGDFLSLARKIFFLFGHRHPFLILAKG